jgi:DNA ligase-associated metallophosphoesterase
VPNATIVLTEGVVGLAAAQDVGLVVDLLPERALFIRAARALVVADLHVGKSESYRRFGVPSTDGIDEESLIRLSRAAMRAEAKVIVVVGDLTHSAEGIGEAERERFNEFRQRCSLPIRLVEGNHDRGARTLPPEWMIDRVGETFELAGIRFCHDPSEVSASAKWTICGHLHPMLSVSRGVRSVEAPAFVVERKKRIVVLPAFSKFTRGVRVEPTIDREVHAIVESTVIGPLGGV